MINQTYVLLAKWTFLGLFFLISSRSLSQPLAENRLPTIEERYRSLETFARAVYFLETMYVDPEKVTPEITVSNALGGIVSNLDPHTVLMPKKAFEQLTIDTRGKFGGVGIIVSQERGRLIIIAPIEDTPAMKAGVKSGDEITAINDKPLSSMSGKDAVDLTFLGGGEIEAQHGVLGDGDVPQRRPGDVSFLRGSQ